MSKRCRISRSSSQREIGVFLPVESPRAFLLKKHRTRVPSSASKTAKISGCMFTVCSLEREKSADWKLNSGFGEFLHNCGFCKKGFKDNFFMYGYLGAFCTPKCRENQMVLDGFEEKVAKDIAMRSKAAQGIFR